MSDYCSIKVEKPVPAAAVRSKVFYHLERVAIPGVTDLFARRLAVANCWAFQKKLLSDVASGLPVFTDPFVNQRNFHTWKSHKVLFAPTESLAAILATEAEWLPQNQSWSHQDEYDQITLAAMVFKNAVKVQSSDLAASVIDTLEEQVIELQHLVNDVQIPVSTDWTRARLHGPDGSPIGPAFCGPSYTALTEFCNLVNSFYEILDSLDKKQIQGLPPWAFGFGWLPRDSAFGETHQRVEQRSFVERISAYDRGAIHLDEPIPVVTQADLGLEEPSPVQPPK